MPRIHATRDLFSYPAWSHSEANLHRSCKNPWKACPRGRSCSSPSQRIGTGPLAVRMFLIGAQTETCFHFAALVQGRLQWKPARIEQKWELKSSDEPTQAFAPPLLSKFRLNHAASCEYPLETLWDAVTLVTIDSTHVTCVWKRGALNGRSCQVLLCDLVSCHYGFSGCCGKTGPCPNQIVRLWTHSTVPSLTRPHTRGTRGLLLLSPRTNGIQM